MSVMNRVTDEFENLGIRGEGQGRRRDAQYGDEYPEELRREFGYAAPSYQPPPDKPPLPGGWIPAFDERFQRWYYVEETSGRSQWEAPGFGSGAPPPANYNAYEQQQTYEEPPQRRGNAGGALMGAAGGLAAGAIGGALLEHALDGRDEDRDDDREYEAPPPQPPADYGGGYVNEYVEAPVQDNYDDRREEEVVEERYDYEEERNDYGESYEERYEEEDYDEPQDDDY